MSGFSNWREEFNLSEVVTGKMTDDQALKKVSEKKGISNKVTINPKLDEAVKEIGGEVISMTEQDTTAQKQRIDMKQMILDRQKLKIRRKDFSQKKREGEDVDSTNASQQANVIAQEETVKQVNEKKRKNALQIQKIVGESVALAANTKLQKKADRKKKEAELRRLLNHAIAVKKGRAESVEPEGDIVEGDVHSGQGEKIQKRTLEWMKKKGQKGAPGLDAIRARAAEHKAKRGVKEEVLDELSKRTLGNYVKDASSDAAMTSMTHGNKPLAQDAPKREKKILKRLSGIRKATDKLSKEEVELDERLGGKGYKSYTSLTGKKVSGDWEDSDRGAGNKAKKRAGGKVEKKSPTYKAHVLNKEEVIAEKDLNASERRALPNKDFALPGKGKGPEGKQAGSYPIPDEKHARSALSLVAQHGTPEEKATVRAKVKKKFPNIDVNEGLGMGMAATAGFNAIGNIAKAYGASQAAKGAIVGGALSGAGALAGGALNYAASRNNNKKKSDVKPKKKDQKESFEIDKSAHKAAQKKTKMRNLARGNENPNEKAAAEKKAGGPKLVGEGIKGEDNEMRRADAADRRAGKKTRLSPSRGKANVANMIYKIKNSPSYKKEEVEVEEGVMKFVKSIGKKKKVERKAKMDPTTDKLHDWRQKNSPEQKEREKYVSPFRPIVKEADDKAYKYVVAQLKKKYGDDAVLTKGQKPKPPTAAQQKKNAEIKAKRAKEDHRDPTEKASDGRYSDRHSNRGSD